MNDTLQTINALRSIHGNFSEKELSQEELNQILKASMKTANASARQSYAIIVLDDRKEMRELFGYQGSRALVYCVDFNRIGQTADRLGHAYDSENIIGFITGTTDTILAAQTAVIAAASLGIDSLITNGLHRNSLDNVYKSLNLPQTSCFPLITVVLGYADEEPASQKGRLSPEFIVHYGKYKLPDNSALDRIIAEYDDPQKHIGLSDAWEKQGFRHYLDWYYTKWEGLPPKEKKIDGKIKEFQDRLVKSGFWWPENNTKEYQY
ncbi:MAG: nitroreductase family protein [Spirochaetales bacterium]|nr:nitroreductase family protein [Spirochaetales bacterium]